MPPVKCCAIWIHASCLEGVRADDAAGWSYQQPSSADLKPADLTLSPSLHDLGTAPFSSHFHVIHRDFQLGGSEIAAFLHYPSLFLLCTGAIGFAISAYCRDFYPGQTFLCCNLNWKSGTLNQLRSVLDNFDDALL